jgi:hypothetical protein
VLYPAENTNGQDMIRRYSTYYNVKLEEYNFITQFQDGIAFSLYSLFHHNFGKLSQNVDALYWSDFFDISGTCLWEEYNSNLISTLFVGEDEIVLNADIIANISSGLQKVSTATGLQSVSTGLQKVSIIELLIKRLVYEQMIVLNDNAKFLSKFTTNIITYIKESYAKYLLDSKYTISSVLINDKTITYTYNPDNYLITLDNFTV